LKWDIGGREDRSGRGKEKGLKGGEEMTGENKRKGR
jgi:hypothetical protein